MRWSAGLGPLRRLHTYIVTLALVSLIWQKVCGRRTRPTRWEMSWKNEQKQSIGRLTFITVSIVVSSLVFGCPFSRER